MLPATSSDYRADPLWAQLPSKERQSVALLFDAMRQIDRSDRTVVAIHAAARELGETFGTLRRKYYAWKRTGDWQVLASKHAMKRMARGHGGGAAQAYKTYCENNQRGSREAWRQMLRDLASDRELPGVGYWTDLWRRIHPDEELPAACPWNETLPPPGWSYAHLQNIAKLTAFERVATRRGLAAARDCALPVLLTRVGLRPGQFYQFDDMWHDNLVAFDGQATGIRPLEFCCFDVLSGARVASGIRARLQDADGRNDYLKEREMRWQVAHLVCDVGFYRGGCTLIVEHGTAAIREALEQALHRLSDGGIKVARSGIVGEQVHAGMWAGAKGGNFKMKAIVEAAHALAHTMLAALPGQTGKDHFEKPEQLAGLVAYDAALVKAMVRISPERRAMLRRPLLHFAEFVRIAAEVYDVMDSRTWHELEGWEECGFTTAEYRLDVAGNWFPMATLDAMDARQSAAVRAWLEANPGNMRVRRLSPREVWQRGVRDLVRLPAWSVPELLGREDGRSAAVQRNGTIQFEDRYFGPGKQIYYAQVETPDGFRQALVPERSYLIHANPYNPAVIWVSDRESGAVLGMAPRYDRAHRSDCHAIEVLMGRQAHDIARQAEPIRERHAAEAAERAALVAHNEAVLAGAPVTDEAKAQRKAIKGFRPADLLGGGGDEGGEGRPEGGGFDPSALL